MLVVEMYYIQHLLPANSALLHLPQPPLLLQGLYPNHQTMPHYENNTKNSSVSLRRMELS